jgi:histidinol-phosphate aminotransferase
VLGGIADLMNRVRQPFNCNNLALAAAVAALDDHEFVARSYALNRAGMEQIVAGLKRLACRHIPSHGNFVTFCVPDAAAVNHKLLRTASSFARSRRTGCPTGCG